MLTTLLLLVALLGSNLAQNTTVSLFIPAADNQKLVGSIAGSDSTATTYFIQCPLGADSSDCGFPGGFTLTEGPSTAHYAMSVEGDDFTGTVDCVLHDTTSATCTQSYGGKGANDPGVSTVILEPSDMTYIPVIITAGAKAGATGTAITGPVSTSAASSTIVTSSATGSTTSQTSGSAFIGMNTGSSSSTGSKSSTGSTTSRSATVGSASEAAAPSTSGAERLGHAYYSIPICALAIGLMAVL